ncbi:polysaccharide biosynthesis protein [Aerococcus urinaehominis]|uniref:Polysaccharide biosynthesis protein n=1 Tax=Aerococcus urinaehominis TaxID=128944 RepID=A0A0X8FML9_9LACT|nr:polysaccharide biosynthesis protein [Aerococcus urinaehominis]AMC00056.1 polysaccharide biosynthesis protein [Aerococcus urinaehominis]
MLRNIMSVAASNIVGFGTSFIINFLLPAILAVSDYGYYREYILYTSYTYLFNLGYNDGINIKYGGRELADLDRQAVNAERSFVTFFQILMFILMLAVALAKQDMVLVFFAVVTFFDTMRTYHQNFLQAIGVFSIYSRGNILKSLFYIGLLLLSVFVFRSDNYYLYIILNILSYVFMYIYYEWHFGKHFGYRFTWSKAGKLNLFRIGFFILIANMSLTFVANVGNWVVKWFYTIEDFARYNFQNSMLNVILLIVNAVGMVFYNIIAKQRENNTYMNIIKQTSLILGIIGGLAFFALKLIIVNFLPQYLPSVSLLSVTFIAVPYIMLSRILIANLYKSRTSEMVYFRDSLIYAGLSLAFVMAAHFVSHTMLGVASATSLCYLFWYIYATELKFPYLKNTGREWLLIASHIPAFYLAANYLNPYLGALVYLAFLLGVVLCFKEDFKTIWGTLKN